MPEKMSQTDAVLYTISVGKATVGHCLEHGDAEMRAVLRREWLVTVGATLDTARAEVERLRAENELLAGQNRAYRDEHEAMIECDPRVVDTKVTAEIYIRIAAMAGDDPTTLPTVWNLCGAIDRLEARFRALQRAAGATE